MFQTDEVLRESLNMFETQKKKLTDNETTYVAPKNKTMAHSMSLKNRVSCVVVISIFGLNKYRQKVFNLIDLNMSPTSKHFLKSETVDAD